MKIAIYGAGAIGGTLGVCLAQSGHDVGVVARGATLAALREHGLRLRDASGEIAVPVKAVEEPAELGPQDLVIVAVKGFAMPDVAARIGPLLDDETMVLTAMNGVPWWFFDGLDGPLAGTALKSVDPQGDLRNKIPSRQVIGGVVHMSCSTPEPGVSRRTFGNGLILGEASGPASLRVKALADALCQAGFEASVSDRIQRDIWYKLWGNMTHNPISALTGATCDLILDDPLVERFCGAIMGEAAAIGERIGCPVRQTAAERNALTRKLGAFKTSMLQDAEAGRPLEIDALLTVVHEIAERIHMETPNIDALLGLIRLRMRATLGLGR